MSDAKTDAKADAAKTDAKVDAKADAGEKKEEGHMTSADYYFNSCVGKVDYAHFGIHEEMLKDEVRTRNYRNSVYQNKHLFKDKVVLDVGCGTGILSLFAAKVGAKKVIGVDCSEIIEQARQIVKDNGYDDVITLVKGKMEEVVLPVDEVDIIVSEWMGYFLFYESMLNTVLYARDKYLKKGGMVLPDKATMYMAGIEDGEYKEEKIEFWNDVYGFDFSAIKKVAMKEPLVEVVGPEAINTNSHPLMEVDIMKVTVEDLTFTVPFSLTSTRNDHIHAFVSWFDIEWSLLHKPIYFSTGPHARYTHWKQTVFYLDEPLVICGGETITGTLKCKPNDKNPRDLDIELHYECEGRHTNVNRTQEFWLR